MSKHRRSLLFVLSLAAALTLAGGPALPALGEILGVYFGPRQAIDVPLIEHFNRAQRSIHVALYALTLDTYANALIRAHRRGVEVKVLLDRGQARHPASDGRRLKAAGVAVRYASGPGLMHHKFSIVDGRIVATGSYNATWSGTYRNSENAVIIAEPRVVRLFEAEFSALWEKSKPP